MVLFYFLSHRVIRSVQYGEKPRNRLDMYVPRNHWRMQKGLRPVVIYVTGRPPGVTPEGLAGSHAVEDQVLSLGPTTHRSAAAVVSRGAGAQNLVTSMAARARSATLVS